MDPLSEAKDFFGRAVRKRRLQMRFGALVIVAIAVGGLLWGLSNSDLDRAMARMMAMCTLGLVGAVIAIAVSFIPHRGLRALDDVGRIVWFYGNSRQGYVHDLIIGLDTGKLHSLPLPHHKEAERGFALLCAVVPSATQGFSEDLRVRFKREPSALRVMPRALP